MVSFQLSCLLLLSALSGGGEKYSNTKHCRPIQCNSVQYRFKYAICMWVVAKVFLGTNVSTCEMLCSPHHYLKDSWLAQGTLATMSKYPNSFEGSKSAAEKISEQTQQWIKFRRAAACSEATAETVSALLGWVVNWPTNKELMNSHSIDFQKLKILVRFGALKSLCTGGGETAWDIATRSTFPVLVLHQQWFDTSLSAIYSPTYPPQCP